MPIRSKLSVVAVFSCCAVMSMGFSGWVIARSGPLYGVLTGGMEAARAIVSNEYIYIADREKDFSLVYTSEGFAVTDAAGNVLDTSYEGTMSVTFTLDSQKCSRLGGGGALGVSVVVGLEGTEKNAPLERIKKAECREGTVSSLSYALSETRDKYIVNFSLLPGTSGTETFTLIYTFSVPEEAYREEFYEVFYDPATDEERGARFSFGVSIRSSQ